MSHLRTIQAINQQIATLKKKTADSNAILITNNTIAFAVSTSTPQKNTNNQRTAEKGTAETGTAEIGTAETGTAEKGTGLIESRQIRTNDPQMLSFLTSINMLNAILEEKCYALEMQIQKAIMYNKITIQQSRKEYMELEGKIKDYTELVSKAHKEIPLLKGQVQSLEASLKEKQKWLEQQLKMNEKLKQQLSQNMAAMKAMKADNRVLMGHIDRLQNQQKTSQVPFEDKEVRVIRSLYKQNHYNGLQPRLEDSKQKYEAACELGNKNRLDDVIDRNADLKSLLKNQNQQLQLLKREKHALLLQNEQKGQFLKSQKNIMELKGEEVEKMTKVIIKMGEKLIAMQKITETYKQSLAKYENAAEDSYSSAGSYFGQTKIKIGSLYHRK